MNPPFHSPLSFFVSFVANKSPMPALLPTAPFPPFKSGFSNLKFLIPLALTLLLGAVATASAEESPKQEHDEAMARYEQAWRDSQDLDALRQLALQKVAIQDPAGLEPFLDDLLAHQTEDPAIQKILLAYSAMVDDKEKGNRILSEVSRNLDKNTLQENPGLEKLHALVSIRYDDYGQAMALYQRAWREEQDLDALYELAFLKLYADPDGFETLLPDLFAHQTEELAIQQVLLAYSLVVDDKEKGSSVFSRVARHVDTATIDGNETLGKLFKSASLRYEPSHPSSDAPVVRYRDPGLGITFEHSADFEPIQFTPPEFSYDLAASMREAGIDWHIVGLVEKRLSRNLDPETLRSGQVPAILLDRHPAVPPTDDAPGGLLEACLTGLTPQRIGGRDAYELPGYPGPYGEEAFCWVVPLPATRRELPPEEGLTEPVGVPIPAGWLLISAPRHFDPDDNDNPEIRRTLETITPLLSPHEKPPTGYDREIRHILETLSPL